LVALILEKFKKYCNFINLNKIKDEVINYKYKFYYIGNNNNKYCNFIDQLKVNFDSFNFENLYFLFYELDKKIGDWGLGIGDWGLGIGPHPQSPIPNPQSPIPINIIYSL